MDIPYVIFISFLEAVLKRRTKSDWCPNKISKISAQIKTRLAVFGSGRMIVKKMIDWETYVQLWIHSNAEVGLQRIRYFYFLNLI